MDGIILYQSKYGATRKYAEWLSEETGFARVETKKTSLESVLPYGTVVLAGGVYASGIAGLSFLKKHIGALSGKKLAIFCDGASPFDEKAFRALVRRNLTGPLAGLPCFYGRGAWDTDAMTFADRSLCRLLYKSLAKKDPSAREPWERALLEAWGHKRDWTDRMYLEPLLREIGR